MSNEIKKECLVFEKSIDIPGVSRVSVFLQEGLQSLVDNLIMSQLCLQLLCLDPVSIDLSAMTVDQRERFSGCVIDYACLRAKEEGVSVLMFEIIGTNLFVLFRSIPFSRFLKEPLSNLSPTLSMLEFSDVFSPLPIESFQARFKSLSIASSSGPFSSLNARHRVVLWHDTSLDEEEDFDVPELNSVRYMVEVMRQYGLCASARKRRQVKNGKPQNRSRTKRGMGRPSKAIIGWATRKAIHVLKWRDATALRNNAGVSSNTWRYGVNNLNQIDVAVASTINGRTVLFSQYDCFRVLGLQMVVDVVNLEAFAVTFGFYPVGEPVDPGANSVTVATSFDMMPRSRSAIVGSVNGNNIKRLTFPYMSLTNWTGFPAYLTDDNFAGLGNATPTTPVYLAMGYRTSGGGVVLVNGIDVDAKFKLTVEFSELVPLAV